MFGSIFVGLSGMNAFSNGLRQISNNITNVNTTGFKSTDLSFANLYGEGNGGRDGSGQGVTLGRSRIDFGQGELRQTDADLDLAIDGGGFLVLLKDTDHAFARSASFEVNEEGFVVIAGTDYRLAVLDETGKPTSVSIDGYRSSPPAPTTTIKLADNLSSTTTAFTLSNIKVFDAMGESDTWQARFERSTTSPAGEWTVIVTNSASKEVGRQTLKFINGVLDPAYAKLKFDDAAEGRSATLDFSSGVTSFSSGETSTLRTLSVDGYGIGEIVSLAVNDQGVLEISYSNTQKKTLGAVAIANFRDPQKLEEKSAGLFAYASAGGIDYLSSAHDTVGRVLSRRAEASNVELSNEFGNLILVQRGFQASSQVVSISNDMIQQLFGMRGQG